MEEKSRVEETRAKASKDIGETARLDAFSGDGA